MKEFKDVLRDFEGHNPFPLFYKHGYTPEVIKKEIIKSFNNFFENKANLEIYAIDGLATTWTSFLTSSRDKGFKTVLNKISSFTRLAFKTDSSSAVNTCFDWSNELNDATNKYWSVKKLQQNTEQLCLEDMVAAYFQCIGQLIESLIKPYVKFHYQLYTIANKNPISKEIIEKDDLGHTLNHIFAIDNNLIIKPLNIPLNQWRNIAYHHNYIVKGKTISCTYGNTTNKKKIILTKKQLTGVLKAVYRFYKTLKISEALVTYDNFQLLQAYKGNNLATSTPSRDESMLIELYTSIGSQGFLVKDLINDKQKTTLTVQDLTDVDPNARGIHSSQFLHVIGKFYKTKTIEVIYKQADGSTYLISSIKHKTLQDFNEGKLKVNELIEHTELNFINNPILKNKILAAKKDKNNPVKKNPFNIHLVSAIPTNERYYSQLCEEIDVKKFIRDFSLAIFSNYLVFNELGYPSDKIRINVGVDGAMIVLEDDKKLMTQVPANIKEQLVQQLIILCSSSLIHLFEKNRLIESLITEARQSNNFRATLSVIQNHLAGNPLI
jgi:hypothetical protein